MTGLARGDHALRLPDDPRDDLSELSGSFNQVARRMEAVQREVGEKTTHLRTRAIALMNCVASAVVQQLNSQLCGGSASIVSESFRRLKISYL